MNNSANKRYMAGFLAAMAMIGFLGVFLFLAKGTIPDDNRDLFNTALIALISLLTTAFGFYLGSSEGSARKNEILAATKDAPPSLASISNDDGFASLRLLAGIGLTCLLLLVGCAGGQGQSKSGMATQTLLSAQTAVIAIAQTADLMCSQGTLTQPQCDQVAGIYGQAATSYDLTADLLAAAINLNSPELWQRYQAKNEQFFKLYIDMTAAAVQLNVMPTIEGGGQK